MIDKPEAIAGHEGIYRLSLTGKLYAQEAGDLERRIRQAVELGARHMVLECSKLQQMDSTIMRAVITGIKLLHEKSNGRVVIVGATDYVSRILALTGLDQFSLRASTEAEALAALS
jgi:anti-anti-sigma factor